VAGTAFAQTQPVAVARSAALQVKSSSALVLDLEGDRVLYAKNTGEVMPIASITKLMTAMVALDAKLSLDDPVVIAKEDFDRIKGTTSRLNVGAMLTRKDLLRLALMASENRAAAALSRAYPGGREAFIAAMNRKATVLGMWNSEFVDGTGLSSRNVSTAEDLGRLVRAAYGYPLIREFSTDSEYTVTLSSGQQLQYLNSNRLVKNPQWEIGLSKTGYISEAGRCLVLQAMIQSRPVVIVLLHSWGTLTRIGDANRIRKWMETHVPSESSGS
jgi:D-alanyl-D-alanine endopeptidase (penicillin-binding protein 7)